MPKRPRLYLAGPEVFHPDSVALGARKKALCAAAGFDGVFPLDLNLALDGLSQAEQARRIFAACEDLMRTCDGAVANATPFRGVSIDSGTAYEIGFMRALGRPVFVYTAAAADYATRAAQYRAGPRLPFDGDRAELEIENFGHAENLMIAVAAEHSGVPLVRGSHASPRIDDLAPFEACLAEIAAHWQP